MSIFKYLQKHLFPGLYSKAQLLKILRTAEKKHLIDNHALSIMESCLQISQMQARDIMLPTSQSVILNENQTIEEMLSIVTTSGHSRFPVFNSEKDMILGILLAKDLLPAYIHTSTEQLNIHNILRPAIFVPESKRLDVLLREFRKSHNHMAIVADEYGNIAGIITIEDVLEQIVGEIEDEYDIDEEANIKKHNENEYIIKALTPISEFNEYFNSQFKGKSYDTVGGMLIQKLGRFPITNEIVDIEKFSFTVINANSRRIRLVKMIKKV